MFVYEHSFAVLITIILIPYKPHIFIYITFYIIIPYDIPLLPLDKSQLSLH